ncbi:MAG: metal/formaldehyde-sensitive transcriptional repressor [Sulfuriferula sp.]
MSHTIRDKQKLLNRVRRVKGQVEAVERALVDEAGCANVLQLIAGCRGAVNGLMAVVIEEHIRTHFVDAEHDIPTDTTDHKDGTAATEQLIDVVHSYFK